MGLKGTKAITFDIIIYSLLGILGTKEYRKPEWVTQMEEMQEALKGKNREKMHQLDLSNSMLSEAEYSFSIDSLNDHSTKNTNIREKDGSTRINESTLTKTANDHRSTIEISKKFYISNKYTESIEIESDLDSIYLESSDCSMNVTTVPRNNKEEWKRKLSKTDPDLFGFSDESETQIKNFKSDDIRRGRKETTDVSKSFNATTKEEKTKKTNSLKISTKVKHDSLEKISSKACSPQRSKVNVTKGDIPEKLQHSPDRSSKINDLSNINTKTRVLSPLRGKHSSIIDSSSWCDKEVNKQRSNRVASKSHSSSPTRLSLSPKQKYNEKSFTTITQVINQHSDKTRRGEVHVDEVVMDKNLNEKKDMKRGKLKITLDFDEFPPPKSERKIQGQLGLNSERTTFLNVPEATYYLSPIEENSEASSTSGQSKLDARFFKTGTQESSTRKEVTDNDVKYEHSRKYHTYPKSRIPVPRWSKERHFGNLTMDSRMYPLEPREIELEAFQQLHTADSQEELQEFLLLESQCSGNLGLASNVSTSEVSYEHHSEDERGTMSGIFFSSLTQRNINFYLITFCTIFCVYVCVFHLIRLLTLGS